MFNVVHFLVFALFFRNDAQEESGHLKASCDCDDVSLLSYNSFRDGTASVTPKTAPASLSYHAGQLPSAGGEELKVGRT